jgi:TM2 domain-containing membrane protein YozV
MTLVLVLVGLLLVALSLLDAILTTVAASAGGGPLTRVLCRVVWPSVQRTSKGTEPSALHRRAGVLMVLSTLALWVALQVAGWFLVFISSERAVLDASTSAPATTVERLYYVGFIVFTLGVGDFVPGPGVWQVLTVLATFLGLFLVTLAVTYVLSVVSAAVQTTALASAVFALGSTPEDVVLNGWAGESFSSAFVQHLVQLSSAIGLLAERHLAYPVLHFFVGQARSSVALLALFVLDDAVLLLERGVAPFARPAMAATLPVRSSIDRYLTSVSAPAHADAHVPPGPVLDQLAAHHIPVVAPEEFADHVVARDDRRRQLVSLVLSQGWDPSGGE